MGLNIIENNVSTLNQLLSATNTYYELQEDDNDFKEQEEQTKILLKK